MSRFFGYVQNVVGFPHFLAQSAVLRTTAQGRKGQCCHDVHASRFENSSARLRNGDPAHGTYPYELREEVRALSRPVRAALTSNGSLTNSAFVHANGFLH